MRTRVDHPFPALTRCRRPCSYPSRDLDGNDLLTLPDGLIEGLTALEELWVHHSARVWRRMASRLQKQSSTYVVHSFNYESNLFGRWYHAAYFDMLYVSEKMLLLLFLDVGLVSSVPRTLPPHRATAWALCFGRGSCWTAYLTRPSGMWDGARARYTGISSQKAPWSPEGIGGSPHSWKCPLPARCCSYEERARISKAARLSATPVSTSNNSSPTRPYFPRPRPPDGNSPTIQHEHTPLWPLVCLTWIQHEPNQSRIARLQDFAATIGVLQHSSLTPDATTYPPNDTAFVASPPPSARAVTSRLMYRVILITH